MAEQNYVELRYVNKKYKDFQASDDINFGIGKGILFGIVYIFAHAAAWGFVAPILDILIYAEPDNKVSVWTFL